MAEDDHSRLVDFTVGQPEASTDEDLPDPRGDRSRAPRVSLPLVAAMLTGGALVAWALVHSGSSNRPTPASTATAVAQTPPVERPVPPLPLPPTTGPAGAVYRTDGPGWCPPGGDGLPACSSVGYVPPQVLAAVRERFPATRGVSAFEEQLRDIGFGPGGLWYREVHVRQGPREITVEVHRQSGPERTRIIEHTDVQGSTLVVTRVVGGFAVRVRVTGPTGHPTSPVSAHALLAFTTDARLRTPG